MEKLDFTSTVNFDEKLRERANEIIASSTMDNITGLMTVQKDFYEKKMGDVIDIELLRKVMAETHLNVNAANLAFSEVSVQAMKENPDLQKTEFLMPCIDRQSLEGSILRSYTRPDKNTGDTVNGYGKLASVAFNDYSTRGKGELKSIKRHLGEIASRHLSD